MMQYKAVQYNHFHIKGFHLKLNKRDMNKKSHWQALNRGVEMIIKTYLKANLL